MCLRLLFGFSPGRELGAPRYSFQNRQNLFSLWLRLYESYVGWSRFGSCCLCKSVGTKFLLSSLIALPLGSLNEPKPFSDILSQSDSTDRIRNNLDGPFQCSRWSIDSHSSPGQSAAGPLRWFLPRQVFTVRNGNTELTNLPIIVIISCFHSALKKIVLPAEERENHERLIL